ncbi:MAG: prepilin-type N-terminal cleavage/methylation domain-containing protein [Planctomycetes bacterium]|nr:prepilin-type N-terminal cleavage/methylation domain-containing protein [Planctomycetota bacterium]
MLKKIKRGFTLIELLVVIAIIALLLAILMPALRKVKERAKQTVCKTNLRGIGIAVHLYLNDNDNRTCPDHGNRYDWFDPSTGLELPPNQAYWGMAYNDYTKNPKIFSCPTFATMKDTIYTIGPGDILGGFGLNRFFENMKASSIRTPSRFIIAQDHAEPHPENNDLFYVYDGGYGYNLKSYRQGSRNDHYWTIFRHSKKSRTLDDFPDDTDRKANTIDNPNGQSNTLWLDGSVDGMDETSGENVRESWYSGK